MTCGVPVAALPVTGPIDVVLHGITGMLDNDLEQAALAALEIHPDNCLAYARTQTWEACTDIFASNLVDVNSL